MNLGNEENVMVVVYSLTTLLAMAPLALELGKGAKATGAEEGTDATTESL